METEEKEVIEEEQEDGQLAEIEEKAMRMGWVAKDNFRGDPDKWVSAERFVERGENELPIMRERLQKMDSTVLSLNNTISDMRKTFSEFQNYQKKAEEKAYKKALQDISRQQRSAVEDGDTAKFDALEQQKQSLEKEMDESKTKTETKKEEPPDQQDYNEWIKDNQWFETDPELSGYAAHISTYIQKTKNLFGKALFDEVTKEVKMKFPDKFENPKRNEPGTVIGDGSTPPKPKKKSFANLPKDAQEQCQRFMKEIPGFTKEEYVENYDWE